MLRHERPELASRGKGEGQGGKREVFHYFFSGNVFSIYVPKQTHENPKNS
jgi:hypothetical protein